LFHKKDIRNEENEQRAYWNKTVISMPADDIKLLMSYYDVAEDWQVFKKICKFWNVK
jgi:hypothetical protein